MATYTEDTTDTGASVSSVILSVSTTLLSVAAALSLATFSTAGGGVLTDSAVASDSAVLFVQLDLSSTGAGAEQPSFMRVADLGDAARASDQLLGGNTASVLVLDTAAASSEAWPSTVIDLNSSAASSDSALPSNDITLDLSSSAAGSSALIVSGGLVEDLTSSATAHDEALHTAVLHADLSSMATASDEVSAPRRMNAWVMDSTHAAMTRYTDLPVSSLAWIGGKVIGLGDEGLFIHEGDRDDDRRINAMVLTGESRLGSSMVKSLGPLYVEYVADGSLKCQIKCASGTFTYDLPPRGAGVARGNRAITGRGLRSLYWQFRFTNVGGADFTITQASVDNAASTNRRI